MNKLKRLDEIIKRLHRLGRVGWPNRKGPGTAAYWYGYWYDRAVTLRYYYGYSMGRRAVVHGNRSN